MITLTRLTLRLIGPVSVTDCELRDLTPRSMKGRGMLAILGVARGLRQTRARLQDLLYSTRDSEQGAASIRQLVRELRVALADHRDSLLTGPGWIGLDEASVAVDLMARLGRDGRPLEFAADLDIPDPEFEDWLRDTRAHFENQPAAPDPAPSAGSGPPRLSVQATTALTGEIALLADMVMLEAAVRASDITPLVVIQPGMANAGVDADLRLCARAAALGGGVSLSVSLVHAASGQTIWSQPFRIEAGGDAAQMHLCAADISLAILKAVEAAEALDAARRFPLSDIFSYSHGRLLVADQALAQTFDRLRPGVALALRAYIGNTLLLERLGPNPDQLLDEADEFSRRAIELAPNNATTLAVGALIASYRDQRETEHRLAAQAMRVDPLNPLAMFAHSQVLSDIDRHQEASEAATAGMGNALSALNPATWLLRRAIASFRHGDLETAQRMFTATHELAPENRPALRFLAALAYHRGDAEGAQRALAKLKRLEPDFSLDLMGSDSYPVQSLRSAGLLSGITRSGLI